MSTGQAPSLMLDLAASHMRDRQRLARERADRTSVRRPRLVPAFATRAR